MNLFEQRDLLIKEVFKPTFKAAGFRIPGTTFKKQEKDFLKIFNIQNSAWNLDDHVSFYLNIGFYFPIVNELKGQEIPKNPKEYDCIFRIRTDSLTGRNQAYDILPETDLSELRTLIKTDLTDHVIPFFERYNELEDCLNLKNEFKDLHSSAEPYIGLTMMKNGNKELGEKILMNFVETTHKEYAETLLSYHDKLTKSW